MLLTEDSSIADYQIKAYTDHSVTINDVIYKHSLIVSNHQIMTDWRPTRLEDLKADDLRELLAFKAEVILLGSGNHFKMPDRALLSQFEEQLNIEVMNTHAACRTFAALSSEGRNVVAALIINENL